MFKGLGDMAGLMKQAKEMQTKMAEAQEKIEATIVDGTSSGGEVKAFVNGKGALQQLQIDPKIVEAGNTEMIEQLVCAAIQDAQDNARAAAKEEIETVTGGMGLPAGLKLPF